MANYVRVSTIGTKYYAPDPGLSLAEAVSRMERHLLGKIEQVLPDRPDLIVLPETCDMPASTTLERRLAFYRERGERILEALAKVARDNRCYVTYPTIIEREDGSWSNCIRMLDRSGQIAGTYHKNYPTFSEMGEGVAPGAEATLIECDFGRVACVICFDLNFDALRLKYAAAQPDLVIFCSMYHGGLMQPYWAYSCRAHFVSAISNTFPSQIISPVGETIRTNTNYYDFASEAINLDCAMVHLDGHWGKLKAMREKYGTKVKVFDPGYLGSVLISSETDEFSARELLREFAFEPLDDYFARAMAGCGKQP
ncbi:MAG: carbon-nitrogen hydrolase family protein [Paenibacillus sp.]|jgi:predicted amidohydrolase|nr:carbon-nitrogen hydrolase family protein [Paenibacillus sp.]